MTQIIRVIDDLPGGFDLLLADAVAEGVNNMALLAEGWAPDTGGFDGPGEALFAAVLGGELAGIGGVSVETGAGERAMRMRRLYVRPTMRRAGVARVLAGAMMQEGFQSAPLLTANARATAAAPVFWEAMGFEAVNGAEFTHQLRR